MRPRHFFAVAATAIFLLVLTPLPYAGTTSQTVVESLIIIGMRWMAVKRFRREWPRLHRPSG